MAYILEFLETLKIHDVFHISLLMSYKNYGKVQPPPPPILEDDELSFDVEPEYIYRKPFKITYHHSFILIGGRLFIDLNSKCMVGDFTPTSIASNPIPARVASHTHLTL